MVIMGTGMVNVAKYIQYTLCCAVSNYAIRPDFTDIDLPLTYH